MSTPASAAEVQSSASPTPTASQDSNRFPGGGGSSSSNLYLVTFLATLFLLLLVSCAIVLRSYVLRRRFQRRLDDAMAAGILLAPRAQGSRKKRFGAKPKFFDAYLQHGGEKWSDMMPLAAQPIFVKRRNRDGLPKTIRSPAPGAEIQEDASDPTHVPLPPPSTTPSPPPPSRFGFIARSALARLPGRRPRPAEVVPTTETPEKPAHIRTEMLQVTMLIAMPSPNRRAPTPSSIDKDETDEEEEIPEVVLGVSRWQNYKPLAENYKLLSAPPPRSPLQNP
ncbi:hypothetical protein BDQ12DRAFT_679671 [Crucibulum laeve]|uniref:Uncharacterized protein n=1 Tax=Crucibulum laeve TaxID=68775 RepID=A0A5C3M5G1_9AGAR|nr:hypothetical protein BDQ12DRAFT_679671 [Crucibulum laeve]